VVLAGELWAGTLKLPAPPLLKFLCSQNEGFSFHITGGFIVSNQNSIVK
jgi:hypothetical protein